MCSCVANAHSLHSTASTPSLDICFLAVLLVSVIYGIMAWVKPKKQSDQVLNNGVSSSEYWRAGYSRRQFRVPFLPNHICRSTTAGRTELCPNIISLKVLGSCDHRKEKQSHLGDLPLSDDEWKNWIHIKQPTRGFLIPHSLACHFPPFSPLKLGLFWGTSFDLVRDGLEACVWGFFAITSSPSPFLSFTQLSASKNKYGQ